MCKRFRRALGGFVVLICLCGCGRPSTQTEALTFEREAQANYQKAVRAYQDLIRQGDHAQEASEKLGGLYYRHGQFSLASAELRKATSSESKKLLGISLYRSGEFTDALDVFTKNEFDDPEFLYYFGMTCEKLNLFDKALLLYRKIQDPDFKTRAQERASKIEKQVSVMHIKNADPRIAAIIQSAPGEEAYPQAGGLILYCDEKIEILTDNTQTADLHYAVKILNERGKEEFSEMPIEYDSTDEKVELEFARTIKPDGTVLEVGSRHIRDVSKYMNFPLYSNARVFIISFPEVTEGAVVEYKARIRRNQLINKKDFVLSYPLQTSQPVLEAHFRVVAPKGMKLHFKNLNEKYNDFAAVVAPRSEEKNDSIEYAWDFRAIPQILPESNMPPGVEINPTVLLSSFGSWEDIYQWWWSLAKEKIKADPSIKQQVKELVAGKKTPEEKVRALYNFCAQKIRYVAVEYGEAGYEPHAAEDIFRNKYGDCKDQAILLVTMMREAGLSAWPVLISTRDYYNLNAEFPSMLFNHCIAAVSVNKQLVFMDPTAETCAFNDLPGGDQARRVLLIKEDGFEIIETPLYPSAHNFVQQDLVIKVNLDESIAVKKTVLTRGTFDQGQRAWLLYTPPQLIEEALKEQIQSVSIGAVLGEYTLKNAQDLSKSVELRYAFTGPEYFTLAGKMRIMPQLSSLDTGLVAKDKRRYPLDFGILQSKETKMEFIIPEGFFVTFFPAEVKEENPFMRVKVTYSQQGEKIFFSYTSELKKNSVSLEEYSQYKECIERLAKQMKQRVVLEKIK